MLNTTLWEVLYYSRFFLVGFLNIYMFSDIKVMNKEGMLSAYSNIYFMALFIPLLSVSGVILSNIFKSRFALKLITKKREGKTLILKYSGEYILCFICNYFWKFKISIFSRICISYFISSNLYSYEVFSKTTFK